MPAKEKSNKRVEFPAKLKVKEKSLRKNWKTITRTYKLITPMFGGGFEAAKYDPITSIRASSIKGQLRFWWRAARVGQFYSLEELKKAEDLLWGAAAGDNTEVGEARIKIHVEIPDRQALISNAKLAFTTNHKGSIIPDNQVAPGYISFPLRPERRQRPSKKVVMPSRLVSDFSLEITYREESLSINTSNPSAKQTMDTDKELLSALWAWETFGGIGARTRRGFGSVTCIEGSKIPVEGAFNSAKGVTDYIELGLKKYVSEKALVLRGDEIAKVPRLPNASPNLSQLLKVNSASNPIAAWKSIITKLREFRQARPGRGRSFWPEPDVIRSPTKANMYLGRHVPRATFVRMDSFPRAQFGLPINFEFFFRHAGNPDQEKRYDKNGVLNPALRVVKAKDPWGTILRPEKLERLASPLILKPLLLNGKAYSLAIILQATGVEQLPNGLVLATPFKDPKDRDNKFRWPVNHTITNADATNIVPLDRKSNPTDILKAFLETL